MHRVAWIDEHRQRDDSNTTGTVVSSTPGTCRSSRLQSGFSHSASRSVLYTGWGGAPLRNFLIRQSSGHIRRDLCLVNKAAGANLSDAPKYPSEADLEHPF